MKAALDSLLYLLMPSLLPPPRRPAPRPRPAWGRGLTVVELLMVTAVLGILVAVSLPSYEAYRERARVAQAKADLVVIGSRITAFALHNLGKHPASLADLNLSQNDPWGRPYRYLRMEDATVGQKRKDRSLHPLNGDFDLYSVGPDGRTTTALTAKASHDDIIRANNGAFIGIAADY